MSAETPETRKRFGGGIPAARRPRRRECRARHEHRRSENWPFWGIFAVFKLAAAAC